MVGAPASRIDRIDDSTCPFAGPRRARELRLEPAEEPRRAGEGGAPCPGCAVPDSAVIWTDGFWRLRTKEGTSLPGTVVLETRDHLDSFLDLPADRLAELGPVVAAIEASLLDLGGVARVHVSRWGDGSAHFHMYFYPRPRGRLQLRGTFLAVWELMLPEADDDAVRRAEGHLAHAMRVRTEGRPRRRHD
jgi:diadenosine tetraphosphate (Ap4A) HIT family hydrolase